jgi:hypothetical protein
MYSTSVIVALNSRPDNDTGKIFSNDTINAGLYDEVTMCN